MNLMLVAPVGQIWHHLVENLIGYSGQSQDELDDVRAFCCREIYQRLSTETIRINEYFQ